MDRLTLVLWAAGAALAMFTLGWTACWLWMRLRSARAHVPGSSAQPQTGGAAENQDAAIASLNQLEAEFAHSRRPVQKETDESQSQSDIHRPV